MDVNQTRLERIRGNILRSRGWRYLRYAHLRDFVVNSGGIRTLCTCGAGLGFAELAIALEFPGIEVFLTDIVAPGRPNYHRVMEVSLQWNVRNLRFGIWDATKPAPRRFDAVASTEILEHIPEAGLALRNMLAGADVCLYALTPFATEARNRDAEARVAAYRRHEHVVCGYDGNFFAQFPARRLDVQGVYWKEFGGKFRQLLMQADDAGIDAVLKANEHLVAGDLRGRPPVEGECFGIKAVYYK